MNDFYADKRYYIDLTKVVFLEFIDSQDNGKINIVLLSGQRYSFWENQEIDYKAFKALKAWHEKKIRETERTNYVFREENRES